MGKEGEREQGKDEWVRREQGGGEGGSKGEEGGRGKEGAEGRVGRFKIMDQSDRYKAEKGVAETPGTSEPGWSLASLSRFFTKTTCSQLPITKVGISP